MRILINSQLLEIRDKILQDLANIYPGLDITGKENTLNILSHGTPEVDIVIHDNTRGNNQVDLNEGPMENIFFNDCGNYELDALDISKIHLMLKGQKSPELRDVFTTAQQRIDFARISKNGDGSGTLSRIMIEKKGVIYIIKTSEISHIEAWGKYSILQMKDDNNYVLNKNLGDVAKRLGDVKFVRCHNSYLVNAQHIIKIKNNKSILMSNGISVPASRRKLPDLRRTLMSTSNMRSVEIYFVAN